MAYFIGVDVGSLSTDVVVIDEAANVLGSAISLTGANSTRAAETTWKKPPKRPAWISVRPLM